MHKQSEYTVHCQCSANICKCFHFGKISVELLILYCFILNLLLCNIYYSVASFVFIVFRWLIILMYFYWLCDSKLTSHIRWKGNGKVFFFFLFNKNSHYLEGSSFKFSLPLVLNTSIIHLCIYMFFIYILYFPSVYASDETGCSLWKLTSNLSGTTVALQILCYWNYDIKYQPKWKLMTKWSTISYCYGSLLKKWSLVWVQFEYASLGYLQKVLLA